VSVSARGSRSYRSGPSLLDSPPCEKSKTEADKDPGDTADATPRPGVVWKDQTGDKPEVEPHSGAGGPQDPPAGSAAGGEHPGDRQYGGVLGKSDHQLA
jgi:hypothetical protein